MRRTGPLGPTLRRLRGARRPPAHLEGLVAEIEAGRTLPTLATLRALAVELGLNEVAWAELRRDREATWSLVRATPWTTVRRAG